MSSKIENNVQEVLGEVLGSLSDNERLKRESNFLRGTIEQDPCKIALRADLPLITSTDPLPWHVSAG